MRFMILAGVVIASLCAAPCAFAVGTATPIAGGGGGVTSVVSGSTNPCADGADNDGDGRADQSDPGCTDGSSESESFDPANSEMSIVRGKALARQAALARFGPLRAVRVAATACGRMSHTRVRCRVHWATAESYGITSVVVFNEVDYAAKVVVTRWNVRP